MMDTVLQDLRYALRTLQRAPLFTLVAVLTLGLGIGATTVVFTILNGVVLRPLQYQASDRLFGVWEQNERGEYRLGSYPAFRGDRSAIGSTIRLNEATYTVVGVLPDWFQFPSWAGVYLPLSTILPTDKILAQRGFHADSRIVAKLKPDVSIKQAHAAMAAIQSRLATAYPADNRGWPRVDFVSPLAE